MTTEYRKVLWEGRSGPNGSLQRPQHAWIANDGEGGEPVFKSYGMQGFRTTKLMRARCSCGDAGWFTAGAWELIQALGVTTCEVSNG